MEELVDLPHVVCGDFNTFQKSDGNDDTWNEILNLYQENNWAAPMEQSLVLESLKEFGYQDTFYHQQSSKKKKPSAHPKPTAWTNRPLMRIDHIFLKNPSSLEQEESEKFVVLEHFRANSDASDHFPVVLDFRIET